MLVGEKRLAFLGIPENLVDLVNEGIFFRLLKDYEKTVRMPREGEGRVVIRETQPPNEAAGFPSLRTCGEPAACYDFSAGSRFAAALTTSVLPPESRGFRRIGLQASAFSEEMDIGAEVAV